MGTQMPRVERSAEQCEYKKLKKEAEDIPPSGVKLRSWSTTEPFLSEEHQYHTGSHPILPCPMFVTFLHACLHATLYP